jgi:ABC-2 type transport system ATP-binding protein
MRQRLALAAALLKDPSLLVLDEPANGLDPAGMRSVRELVRGLAREGRTVLVSSHLLGEIQQTCDRLAILDRGRCITEGTVAEVNAAAGHHAALIVGVEDPAAALSVLVRAGFTAERRDGILRVTAPASAGARVSRTLGRHGHWVHELRVEEHSLEELFLEVTNGASPGGTRLPEVAR